MRLIILFLSLISACFSLWYSGHRPLDEAVNLARFGNSAVALGQVNVPSSIPTITASVGYSTKTNLVGSVVSIKSSASGNLYSVCGTETGTGVQCWIQIFDAALPGGVTLGTTVPIFSISVPTGSENCFAWSIPVSFTNGIQWAATLTSIGAGACTAQVLATAQFN